MNMIGTAARPSSLPHANQGSGAKILLVEDEQHIVELVRYNLDRAGFCTMVAVDGSSGLAMARCGQPDLVLLDWMLPHVSGEEICRVLREDPVTRTLPVIMLTSKGEEADKIAALNAGADDYVTKPFSPAELNARIGAVLRRAVHKPQIRSLQAGPLTMDLPRRKVLLKDEEIRLGPTEFRLLEQFMNKPGEVLSRERLLDLVWGKDIYVELRTVDVHIRRLRKALDDNSDPGLIRTVRSSGYALNVESE